MSKRSEGPCVEDVPKLNHIKLSQLYLRRTKIIAEFGQCSGYRVYYSKSFDLRIARACMHSNRIQFDSSTCQCMSEPENLYSVWAVFVKDIYSECSAGGTNKCLDVEERLHRGRRHRRKKKQNTHSPYDSRGLCNHRIWWVNCDKIHIWCAIFVVLFIAIVRMGMNLWFVLANENETCEWPHSSTRNLLTMKIIKYDLKQWI